MDVASCFGSIGLNPQISTQLAEEIHPCIVSTVSIRHLTKGLAVDTQEAWL